MNLLKPVLRLSTSSCCLILALSSSFSALNRSFSVSSRLIVAWLNSTASNRAKMVSRLLVLEVVIEEVADGFVDACCSLCSRLGISNDLNSILEVL